jgi:hypothetical protein
MNVLAPIKPLPDSVIVTHCIVAYERATDKVAFEQDIPKFLDTLAFKLSEVDEDDPTAAFSYVLSPQQISTFSFLLGIKNDVESYEYLLEPCEHKLRELPPQKVSSAIAFETLSTRSARTSRQSRRITESELTVPTLRILEDNDRRWVRTSELIGRITQLFRPTGTDAAILAGRSDTYFSQKVRNMISHRDQDSSFIRNGLADYNRSEQGLRITELGGDLVSGLRS